MAIIIDFNLYEADLPIVKSHKIFKNGPSYQFDEDGLYSEKIFGPLKSYKCNCGDIKSQINDGIRCEKCGVLCASENLRNTTFAKIELPVFIIQPMMKYILFDIFGQTAIKNIMDPRSVSANKEDPWYYNKDTKKLTKIAKTQKTKKIKTYMELITEQIYTCINLINHYTDYYILDGYTHNYLTDLHELLIDILTTNFNFVNSTNNNINILSSINNNLNTILNNLYDLNEENNIIIYEKLNNYLKKKKSMVYNKIDIKNINTYLVEFPVYDIYTLYLLFSFLKTNNEFKDLEINQKFLDFVFVDYILVLPVNSRPLVQISPEKYNVHPITAKYIEILNNQQNSLIDNLAREKPLDYNTSYKYQKSVNELYDILLEKSFQEKENTLRNNLFGKTIEFSSRQVIVPNPVLKIHEIGLHKETVMKINIPEILHFLHNKYNENPNNEEKFSIVDYIQYIERYNTGNEFILTDDEFSEFIKKYANHLIYIVERPPVLWKHNCTAFTVKLIFNNRDNNLNFVPLIKANSKNWNYRKGKKLVNSQVINS